MNIDENENDFDSTMKPGEIVGKYKIISILGSGSMGTVYKAYNMVLERTVALKTINELTEKSYSHFKQEARNMAKCESENVVKIYDTDVNPMPYIEMEYVDGVTLKEWAQKLSRRKRQKEKEMEIVKVFIQLGAALQEIHKHKLMHLDIKPGNIMVTKKDKPKLMDFGISQKIKEFAKGTIAGTPHYMAIEQAKGEATAKSDIYALGATLYEVVTGHPPFYEQRIDSVLNLLFKVITHEPRRLTKINPDVSKDIEAICLKCMHKNQERRYASAKQFTRDLDNFLKNTPLLANKLNFWEKNLLFIKKHRFICAFLALAITSAIVSTILAVTINKHRNEIYEQNKLIVSQNEQITNQNYEYGKISSKYYSSRGQIFRRYGEDALENNKNEDDILDFYQNALENYQKSIKIANDIGFQYAKPFNNIFSLSMNRDLLPEHLLQKNIKILERFQEITEANPYKCLQQAIAIDNHYNEAYFNMGLWYVNNGKIREAIENFTKAIDCVKSKSETYKEDYEDNKIEAEKWYKQTRIDSFFNRGALYDRLDELPKALADYNQAILLNNQFVDAYFNRAIIYYKQKQDRLALQDIEIVLTLNPNDKKAHELKNAIIKRGNK